MTYSKLGDEPPKLFHASAQTRTGPGGVSCASLEMNLQTFKWENKFKILFTAIYQHFSSLETMANWLTANQKIL